MTIEEGPPFEMRARTGGPTGVSAPVTKSILKTEIVPASPLDTYANCDEGSTRTDVGVETEVVPVV